MRRVPPCVNSAGLSRPHAPGIRRRDFLNGIQLAAGGAALAAFSPWKAFAAGGPAYSDGSVDPNMLRGGNYPSVFNVAHWMRDGRLSWTTTSVTLAAGRFDSNAGTFPISDDNGTYDVIIVGSGMSAMSSAYFLLQDQPTLRILLLEANPDPGGNAWSDHNTALATPAGTAGAYAVAPYADFLVDLYAGIGIDWERFVVPAPGYAYFFDENTPYVNAGTRSWTNDVYGDGLRDMPYSPEIIQDLHMAKQDFRNWYCRNGSPTDPADDSDPRYDYLAAKTLEEYLLVDQGYHPAVVDFYTAYAIDALAGQCHQVNAYTSISFLGAEYFDEFALPGGNGGLARHFLKRLVPGSLAGTGTDAILASTLATENLDLATNNVRIRTGSVVLRADNSSGGASAVYYKGGSFYRARAGAVILATQSHSAKHIVDHLIGSAQRTALADFLTVPVVTANVTLRSAAPIVNSANAYDLYWWGSQYWADAVVADWTTGDRTNPDRPVTLTFYGGNWSDPAEIPAERLRLLQTSFGTYEDSLRDDLERIFADQGFDFDRDVTDVGVYRWGHGMIYPKPGTPHGAPTIQGGRYTRNPAPRHTARQQIGRISIAGQDTESSPALESAFGSGLRVAQEILELL
jgi:spermidine dehydrogenase